MGAINYGNNKYFNMGMDLSPDYDEYDYQCEYEYQFEETQNTIDKYNFNFFKIWIENGYYEGFYLCIDFDFLYFDDWNEKREMLKEITQLKHLLKELCYNGLVKYSAGWCMAYYSEDETKQAIKTVIKEIKQNILNIPTWRKYHKKKTA
jgi:hypothetical protein